MQTRTMPMVLRSRLYLSKENLPDSITGLTEVTEIYAMAQEAAFIDAEHYAVGRWDGSLSIFKVKESAYYGPVIVKAVNGPAQEGIQMLTSLYISSQKGFVSSNSEDSIAVWQLEDLQDWANLGTPKVVKYSGEYGVANRGILITANGKTYVVIGHSNGYISVWLLSGNNADLTFVNGIDIRSEHPVNPWDLHNIRGLADLGGGCVAAGSEDGNLTVVRIPDGKILSAAVYNPDAQRGINNIAYQNGILLVANCAVGNSDNNLWSYKLNSETFQFELADKVWLKIDEMHQQVFNFDVIFDPEAKGIFYSSTEEGALWKGKVNEMGKLSELEYMIVTDELGSALCMKSGILAVASYNIKEFLTEGGAL